DLRGIDDLDRGCVALDLAHVASGARIHLSHEVYTEHEKRLLRNIHQPVAPVHPPAALLNGVGCPQPRVPLQEVVMRYVLAVQNESGFRKHGVAMLMHVSRSWRSSVMSGAGNEGYAAATLFFRNLREVLGQRGHDRQTRRIVERGVVV